MTDPAEAIIALYRRHARTWAAARGERLPEREWIDRFAALLPARGRVMDLGCGPGVPVARHLSGLGHAVTGIDSAPEMIAQFRASLPGAEAVVADMRTLDLGRTFDGILAWDSFFHLAHAPQRAMFPIFRAHAAPGAPLMFTSGPEYGEAIGLLEGEPLYHASLDPAAYRALLDANGFQVVDHMAEEPAAGGRTIWLARRS